MDLGVKTLIIGQIIFGVLLDVDPRIWTKMGQGMHLGRNIQGDLVSQGHASAGSALHDPDRERLLMFIFWEVPRCLILVSLLMGFQTDKLRQLVGCEERLSNGSFLPPSPTPHQPASHHHVGNR